MTSSLQLQQDMILINGFIHYLDRWGFYRGVLLSRTGHHETGDRHILIKIENVSNRPNSIRLTHVPLGLSTKGSQIVVHNVQALRFASPTW